MLSLIKYSFNPLIIASLALMILALSVSEFFSADSSVCFMESGISFMSASPCHASLFLAAIYAAFFYFYRRLKTAEEKTYTLLIASEEKFRLMIENTPVGVCIIDEYGMFEYVNTAFTELYEYEHDELIGNHITVIILENLYELALKNYNDFINSNIPLSHEWSASTKSGKKLTVLVNSAKTSDITGRQKSILFIVDITGRQKMEQELIKSREILKTARDAAESLNRQKSRFLASVSHDIRTPLNSVIGFSELLEQSQLSEAQKEMVRCVKNSGSDLLALINDILDLSKIEAGKFEIENAEFDIREVFNNAIKSIFPQAQKKGLNFAVMIDENITKYIVSDSHRYKQVLNNLLSNAVKFCESGEIKAELKIVSESASYYMVRTRITDSGIGIEPQMLEKLFEPFVQCGHSVSQKYGGTGLGLAISNQIVKLLGGEQIKVESEIGRGSRFYFDLNVKTSSNIRAVDIDSGGSKSDNQYSRWSESRFKPPALNILAADDSEINIKLIKTILEGEGHTLVTAENGREAVEFGVNASFDLILMDINMPELNGYQAASELRRLGIKAPIIAITAAAMEEEIAECKKNGMNDVITKPIRYDAFIDKINEYAFKIKSAQKKVSSLSGFAGAGRSGGAKIFDGDFLMSNTCGRKDIAAELLSIFCETCEKELLLTGALIETNDFGQIRLCAHKIKGSALNVGANILAATAAEFEAAVKSSAADETGRLYLCLKSDYEKFKNIVKNEKI